MTHLKIFIGSSSEAMQCAQLIQELLQDIDNEIEVLGWWNETVFQSGDTHIESLFKAISATNAAILIFAEDDRVERRGVNAWTTRDNILLEYGMFAAAHGRRNVLVAKLGNPALPSDLSGLNVRFIERCEDSSTFKERNRGEVRRWLDAVKKDQADKPAPELLLPRLYQAMLSVFGAARSSIPELAIQMDYMAAELVNAIAVSLKTRNLGVDDDLADSIGRFHLHDCISICAYEVTGPASWVNPTIFRYLSGQIRQYLWANITGGKWHLTVHDWLGEAITRAIENARRKLKSQSLTIFDNPQDFHWEIGSPSLQYSRVLFWTKEELAHSITESVIDIHEAFNIPLFFVEANAQSRDKDLAFIAFEKSSGGTTGRFGLKRFNYKTREIQKGGVIPGFGSALDLYRSLLKREDLMFAKDARELLYLNSE
jgi:hypothetical protein